MDKSMGGPVTREGFEKAAQERDKAELNKKLGSMEKELQTIKEVLGSDIVAHPKLRDLGVQAAASSMSLGATACNRAFLLGFDMCIASLSKMDIEEAQRKAREWVVDQNNYIAHLQQSLKEENARSNNESNSG